MIIDPKAGVCTTSGVAKGISPVTPEEALEFNKILNEQIEKEDMEN